jgi:hypothetical protein
MNIYIIGDLHQESYPVDAFYKNYLKGSPAESEENWLICLGDFGANYFFDHRDRLASSPRSLQDYP